MKKLALIGVSTLLLLSGCASVPTVDSAVSNELKKFDAPSEGNAGIYVYRIDSAFGGALKKDVYIDGECIGETAPGVFFYHEVAGDQEHTVATESEFSPNEVKILTEDGKLYFIEQYIKVGLIAGGADLEVVDQDVGKAEVMKVNMAIKGTCTSN